MSSLAYRIERAKARHRLRQQKSAEEKAHKAEAAARRRKVRLRKKEELSRTQAAAERALQAQRQATKEAQTEAQAAKRARLLTERELTKVHLQSYIKPLMLPWKGLKKLGEMGQEYHRKHPDVDPLWGPAPPRRKPRKSIIDFDPDQLMR